MPPPINLSYEPTPFLQVASSFWGQRRQMAHQVAVQQDQSALQWSAQAQQSFQSGMSGLRQGAAAYQQAQQFEAGLAQQQQQFEQSNQRLYDTAYLRYFGMTEQQIRPALDLEIANGTVPADTTIVQYQRKLEIARNKLANEPAFARAQYQHWTRKTGLPPDVLEANWTAGGGAAGTGYGTWQEYGIAFGQQRQAQDQARQLQVVRQAEEQGQILRAAQTYAQTQPNSEVGQALARFREAEVIASAAQQGHGIPDGLTQGGWAKQTQATAKEAFADVRNALVKTQPDRAAIREDREKRTEIFQNPDGGFDRVYYNQDGSYERVTTWTPDDDGADVGKVYTWADKVVRNIQVENEETGEWEPIRDEAEIAKRIEALIQGRERSTAPPTQGPRVSREDRAVTQRADQRARQSYQPEDFAKVQKAAEQIIAQFRRKRERGEQLTPEEEKSFQQAYQLLETPQPETPQPTPASPAVDEARRTIRELLAKRHAGGQITPEERNVLQAARDVLAGATP